MGKGECVNETDHVGTTQSRACVQYQSVLCVMASRFDTLCVCGKLYTTRTRLAAGACTEEKDWREGEGRTG